MSQPCPFVHVCSCLTSLVRRAALGDVTGNGVTSSDTVTVPLKGDRISEESNPASLSPVFAKILLTKDALDIHYSTGVPGDI